MLSLLPSMIAFFSRFRIGGAGDKAAQEPASRQFQKEEV